MIYLDNNATTSVAKVVFDSMRPYLDSDFELYGNPSSVYVLGQKSKNAIEDSRECIARYLSCDVEEIIFTSSGTEANALAIKGVAFSALERGIGNHIIASKIEHDSILACLEYLKKFGFHISLIDVDSYGKIDVHQLSQAITDKTILVSVMHVNNEIGTIQPIHEIANICQSKNVLFHTDAVQSIGKIPIDLGKTPINLLSLSSHKLYGPKGVGALFVKYGTRLHPLVHGNQEKSYRAGTENVAGIVGFGSAIQYLKNNQHKLKDVEKMRDTLEKGIVQSIPDVYVNGDMDNRVVNTSNISFHHSESESLVVMLDLENIAVSSGSACSSGAVHGSHVLVACGFSSWRVRSSIRFSLTFDNTFAEIDIVLQKMPKIIQKLRSVSPLWNASEKTD